MPPALIVNVALSGILTGLVYGLMALGLSVIYGVIRVVNFGHGEMMTLAMYAAVILFARFHLDPLLMLVPISCGLFLLGALLQATIINPFITRPEHAQFMLLLAVSVILTNTELMVFGPDSRNAMVSYGMDSFGIGPILVDKVRVYTAVCALLVAGALYLFFKFSSAGKAIRACADNYFGARVVGLNVRRLFALTFGIGAACVGAAGCMLALLVDVSPPLGPAYTLLAFVIVIVGGLGSMVGALLGGVLIGFTEALAGLFFSPSAKSMFSFAILILLLLLRPQGLLGKRA